MDTHDRRVVTLIILPRWLAGGLPFQQGLVRLFAAWLLLLLPGACQCFPFGLIADQEEVEAKSSERTLALVSSPSASRSGYTGSPRRVALSLNAIHSTYASWASNTFPNAARHSGLIGAGVRTRC